MDCVFCRIIRGEIKAYTVYEDADVISFLDASPLFPGHVLVCPKQHIATMLDLPEDLYGPMMKATKLIAAAVQAGLEAEGSFVAVNNTISQSVPHLHMHVVPRKKGDGLKGFFWPRHPYRDQDHMQAVKESLARAIEELAAVA